MGADGSSGSSQQCPRDEAGLRYTAQRGKVPGTLQKNGPENMTAGKQGMKGKAGTSMTNFKERTVKCQGNCCLPSWCRREAAKLFGGVIFMAGILCKYCKNDQGTMMACAVCITPTCAQGWEPCLPSRAAGVWAAKLWLTFPHGWTVLLIRKTHTFYVQTLSFPSCHRKGFRHIILASRKTPNSVSGIWCFPASPAMHPSVKKW